MDDWSAIHERVRASCAEGGLDLVHPFGVADWNRDAAEGEALEDLGSENPLGLVVGSTKAFWRRLLEALRGDADLRREAHPVDRHVERVVTRAAAAVEPRTAIHWAHTVAPRALPVQRIAHAAGLAHLSPSHLSIHPVHGPWIALRAVIVVDVEGPARRSAAPDPCSACGAPCVSALRLALAEAGSPDGPGWRKWLAVRDVCPEGRTSRYPDEQIRYHYTKARGALPT